MSMHPADIAELRGRLALAVNLLEGAEEDADGGLYEQAMKTVAQVHGVLGALIPIANPDPLQAVVTDEYEAEV